MNVTTDRSVITVSSGETERRRDTLVQQIDYTIELNGSPAMSSVCCPGDLSHLALGYLLTQGICSPSDAPPRIDQNGNTVRIAFKTDGRVAMPEPVKSAYAIAPRTVLGRVVDFVKMGLVFSRTGATHSAAICTDSGIVCHVEDISRSAVLEKVIGEAWTKGIFFGETFIILSSRVPDGFVQRVARAGIPIIAAVSAPTAQAVERAEDLGICLCGFVRGRRMNVYSGAWRLGL